MVKVASVAGPVQRFIVEAYQNIDTGGPEALVQLALALDSLCPNSTYLTVRPTNPRLQREYPAIASMPKLAYNFLRRGDLYVTPEHIACDRQLGAKGVRQVVYMLSAKARRRNYQSIRAGCRLISHNYWGAQHTAAGLDLTPEWVVRPYISPSIRSRCLARTAAAEGEAAFAQRRDLVLIDHDVPSEVEAAARAACDAHGYECVRVGSTTGAVDSDATRRSREEVLRLLEAAKVVIDWCLVGAERLAIEAMLCGAVLLTSACKAGLEPRDFPLPRRNVLDAPANLTAAIPRVVRGFAREQQRGGATRVAKLYGALDAASMRKEASTFLGAAGLSCASRGSSG